MGSTAWHIAGVVVGAVLILAGGAVVGGRAGQTSLSERWRVSRVIGVADMAIGLALLLFGLFSHHLWAVLISAAAFAVGAICVITWLVKAVARRADDEFDSA